MKQKGRQLLIMYGCKVNVPGKVGRGGHDLRSLGAVKVRPEKLVFTDRELSQTEKKMQKGRKKNQNPYQCGPPTEETCQKESLGQGEYNKLGSSLSVGKSLLGFSS